ncbi:Cytoplasmic glyoxalase II [Blastocladiella emersonii ATCC 22665]|nr:Cytoplasmic glyoxalase II [Blastocladiella emersonii ATCC 22665]
MMKVYPVPCLSDNYAYVLVDETTNEAAVVDPVEPSKVLAKVAELGVDVRAVLTTHHHHDHAGGNSEFVRQCAVPVYGGDQRIPALSHPVGDGDALRVGSIAVRAMHTPCHTTGHICFYCEPADGGAKAVFSGDTLFLGGCGRFFEGDGEQFQASLDKLAALPDDTLVYCGHEYTLSNLKFAATVEPDNTRLAERLGWAKQQTCTIPGSIGEEKATNPFLRTREASVQRATGQDAPAAVMGALREQKNKYRG